MTQAPLPFAATLVLLLSAAGASGQEAVPPTQAPPDLSAALALEHAFTGVLDRLRPSLVTVTSYVPVERPTDADGRPNAAGMWAILDDSNPYPGYQPLASATGFVYDAQGTILSAWHALLREDRTPAPLISVETPDRRHWICEILGGEPTINVAVLAIRAFDGMEKPMLPPVTVGDSEAVRPGQWAIAPGDPFGALRTCATGIFTARPLRQCYQGDMTATMLQTSLTAHPEAYGGPVTNIRGEVVGQLVPRYPKPKVTPSSGAPGVELAMPIEIVTNIADGLVQVAARGQRSEQSPWLGLSVLEITTLRAQLRERDPEALRALVAPPVGVFIDDVFTPGPAVDAGIEVGDYLLSIDGHRLLSVLDFQKWLYLSGVGRTAAVEVFRDGAVRKVEIAIAARPAEVRPR
ncbi:MAG: trypsin-like peptidase domain-containing protein [Planctomycetota bacterium]